MRDLKAEEIDFVYGAGGSYGGGGHGGGGSGKNKGSNKRGSNKRGSGKSKGSNGGSHCY